MSNQSISQKNEEFLNLLNIQTVEMSIEEFFAEESPSEEGQIKRTTKEK